MKNPLLALALVPMLLLTSCPSLPNILTDINLALTAAVPILAAFGGPAAQATEVSVYFAQAANAVVACSSTQGSKLVDVSTCIAIAQAVLDSTPKVQGDPQLQKQIDVVSAELQALLKQLGAPTPTPVTGAIRPRGKWRVTVMEPVEIKPADAYKLEQVRTRAVQLRSEFTKKQPRASSFTLSIADAAFRADVVIGIDSAQPDMLYVSLMKDRGPNPVSTYTLGTQPTLHIIKDNQ